jgi:hypothetical protein
MINANAILIELNSFGFWTLNVFNINLFNLYIFYYLF